MENRCADDAALLEHERSSVDTHIDKFAPYDDSESESSCCCCFGGAGGNAAAKNWIATFRRWFSKVFALNHR